VSVQQATFLLPAIEERVESASMRDRAAEDVPENLRAVRVDVDAVSDVSVLRIRGTSESPQAAQVWVNAIADRIVEEQSADSPVVLGVLDPAPLKRKPISPNVEPIMVAFIVVGLIAALFSTLAADRIKQAFDTNQAVRDRLGTTVLGEIPALSRRTERRRPIISLLSGRQPSLPLTAAFEAIRTNVEFRLARLDADRVAVISLTRDDGRSMIAAGLSYSMAAVGRNVVAIEADLRRPRLSEQLNVKPLSGLGDIVTFGPDSLVLQPTLHPRLQVLPAGLPAGRAADVVASSLPGVIDRLAEDSRTLVIDSPPLRGAPESAIVIANARYVVLTVNNSSSEFANLMEAIDLINDAGGVLLGVVINGVSRRRIRHHDDHDNVRDVKPRDDAASVARVGVPDPSGVAGAG
jgi:Mrp family chromosome partitioning ATPase